MCSQLLVEVMAARGAVAASTYQGVAGRGENIFGHEGASDIF